MDLDRAYRIARDTEELLERVRREGLSSLSRQCRDAAYDMERLKRFLNELRQRRS